MQLKQCSVQLDCNTITIPLAKKSNDTQADPEPFGAQMDALANIEAAKAEVLAQNERDRQKAAMAKKKAAHDTLAKARAAEKLKAKTAHQDQRQSTPKKTKEKASTAGGSSDQQVDSLETPKVLLKFMVKWWTMITV